MKEVTTCLAVFSLLILTYTIKVLPMKNLEFNTKDEISIKRVASPLQKLVPKDAKIVQNAIFGGGGRTGTQDFVLLSKM